MDTNKPSDATATYAVDGMTCAHCRTAVIERVCEIPEVEHASVDLESGRLHVRFSVRDDSAIEAAVRDAGYQVVRLP
jgi:copper chaperone